MKRLEQYLNDKDNMRVEIEGLVQAKALWKMKATRDSGEYFL